MRKWNIGGLFQTRKYSNVALIINNQFSKYKNDIPITRNKYSPIYKINCKFCKDLHDLETYAVTLLLNDLPELLFIYSNYQSIFLQ